VRETLILFQRCTFCSPSSSSVLPLIFRPCSSSSVSSHRSSSLLLLVYRPSSVVNRLLSAVRLLSSSVRHPTVLHHRSTDIDSEVRTSTLADRASSSSVVSQAVQRAVVCWSEEDNSIPFITGFELSVKISYLITFYN